MGYWDEADVDDPRDRRHLATLSDPRATAGQWRLALAGLLDSPSVVAQGIAIDTYSADQMSGRWGSDPPSAPLRDRVAATIRAHLAAPPVLRDHAGAGPVAVNHACALAALRWVVTPDDAELIATIAGRAGDSTTRSSLVLAARNALRSGGDRGGDVAAGERVLRRVLAVLAADEGIDPGLRADAVLALVVDDDPERVGTLLRNLLRHREPDLSAAAALVLMRAGFAGHHTLIATRLDDWKAGTQRARAAWNGYHQKAAETDGLLDLPARIRAVRELSATSDALDTKWLLRLLGSREPDLSAAAAIGLMRWHFPAYRTYVAERMGDWTVGSPIAQEARDLYHLLVVQSKPRLDQAQRVAAVLELSAASGPPAKGLLQQLLTRSSDDMSAAAAIALMRTHFTEYRTRIADRVASWDADSPVTRQARQTYHRLAGGGVDEIAHRRSR